MRLICRTPLERATLNGTRTWLEPLTTRIVSQCDGDGPLYVLVPGLGAEGEIFSLVANVLRDHGKRYVIIEPLGFGYREPSACNVTLSDAAEAAYTSGALTDEPAIYAGHSAGAMEAIELAKRNPNAIGLVLVNGTLDDLSDAIRRPLKYAWRHPHKVTQLASLVVYLTAKFPEFVLRKFERPGAITAVGWPLIARPRKLSGESLSLLVRRNRCPGAWRHLRTNRHYNLAAQAPELTVPVLAICGKRDPLATRPHRSRFLKACTASVDTVLLDTGHHCPIEAPEEVAAALIEFAKTIE